MKSKQITMAYLENTTSFSPKIGDFSYLRSMKEKNDINHLDEDYPLTPYTMEEIKAMIDEAELDFEAGRYYTTEEVFREIEEEINKLRLESL